MPRYVAYWAITSRVVQQRTSSIRPAPRSRRGWLRNGCGLAGTPVRAGLTATTIRSPGSAMRQAPCGRRAGPAACTAGRRPTPSRAVLPAPRADRHRIVLADHLPEVPRRGQMVMQAAVGDEEDLAARDLSVDHASRRRCRPRRRGSGPVRSPARASGSCGRRIGDSRCRFAPIGRQVERLLAGEVRNAEAAAEVERCASAPARARPAGGPARSALLCASQIASARRFCEPEKMWKPSKASPSRAISLERLPARASASMPNCFGPPPIFMPEDFSSKSGLTRTATRAGAPSACCDSGRAARSSRSDSTLTSTPAATA